MDHLPDGLLEQLVRRTPQLVLVSRRAWEVARLESFRWDFQRVLACQWAAPRELNDLVMLRELQAVDHLVVRGWLVQGYRVLAGEQSFEDFLAGLKLLLPTGYQLTQDDHDLLLSLVAYLDVGHGRGAEGRQILDLLADRRVGTGLNVSFRSPVIEAWLKGSRVNGEEPEATSGDSWVGGRVLPTPRNYFVVHPTRWRDLWDVWFTNPDPPWADEPVNQSSVGQRVDELLAMGWRPRYWNLIMFHAPEVIRALLQRKPELVKELFRALATCLGEDWFALEMQAPFPLLTALSVIADYADQAPAQDQPPTEALHRLPPELRDRYLARLGRGSEGDSVVEFKSVEQLTRQDQRGESWLAALRCYLHSWDYYLQWRHALQRTDRQDRQDLVDHPGDSGTDDELLARLVETSLGVTGSES